MRVGVGLPTGVPGADGQLILEWARRADEGPFSSLGVVDRLVYDSYEPFMSLAAAATVTRRVRLATTIVIGLLRDTTLLAKMAASLDAISDGRLVLGLGMGARKDDYDAAGIDYRARGKRFSEQLATLRALWEAGDLVEASPATTSNQNAVNSFVVIGLAPAISPRPSRPNGPPLLVGGSSDAGFARMARYADGYVHGGGPPRAFARAADKAYAAWVDFERPGRPQLWAQGYFALGDDDVIEAGRRYMRDYYAFTGPFAERVAAGMLTNPQALAQFLRGYEDAGCDELVLFPAVADLKQLDKLTDVLVRLGRSVAA